MLTSQAIFLTQAVVNPRHKVIDISFGLKRTLLPPSFAKRLAIYSVRCKAKRKKLHSTTGMTPYAYQRLLYFSMADFTCSC